MKIEKISDYKVKITISSIDLEEKHDMDDLVCNIKSRNCSGYPVPCMSNSFEVRMKVVEANPTRGHLCNNNNKIQNRQLLV